MERNYEYHLSGVFKSHRMSFDYQISKESYDELCGIGVEKLFTKDIVTYKRGWSAYGDIEEMGQGMIIPSEICTLNLYKKPK